MSFYFFQHPYLISLKLVMMVDGGGENCWLVVIVGGGGGCGWWCFCGVGGSYEEPTRID